MSSDTKWIVGTVIGATTVHLAVMALLFTGVNGRFDDVNARFDDVNARIDRLAASVQADIDALRADVRADVDALRADVRADFDALRADVRALDARLRAVEVAFGKIDQRLLTLERVILPARDGE